MNLTETPRISRRMKNALIADVVLDDLSERGDRVLAASMNDEHQWTDHLARQLGFGYWTRASGLHDTLMYVVERLDVLVRDWPPNRDESIGYALAEEATRHLQPMEIYSTLLEGPAKWHELSIDVACRLSHLPQHLLPVLQRALGAEIRRMLEQWVKWDVPSLERRRKEAIKAAETPHLPEPIRAPRKRPERPTGKDQENRLKQPYRPPGRT